MSTTRWAPISYKIGAPNSNHRGEVINLSYHIYFGPFDNGCYTVIPFVTLSGPPLEWHRDKGDIFFSQPPLDVWWHLSPRRSAQNPKAVTAVKAKAKGFALWGVSGCLDLCLHIVGTTSEQQMDNYVFLFLPEIDLLQKPLRFDYVVVICLFV